jgi:hypothetical protein
LRRNPKSLLWDAREVAELIAAITNGKTFDEFDRDVVAPDPHRYLVIVRGSPNELG